MISTNEHIEKSRGSIDKKEIREKITNYIIVKLDNEKTKFDILEKEMQEVCSKIEYQEELLKEIYPKLNDLEKELFIEPEFISSLNMNYAKYLEYRGKQVAKFFYNIINSVTVDFIDDLIYFYDTYLRENKNIDLIIKLFINAKIDIFEYENSSIDKKKSKDYHRQTMLKKANSIQPFSKYPINLEIPAYKDEILKKFISQLSALTFKIKQSEIEKDKILIYLKEDDFLKVAISLISKNIKLPKNYKQPKKDFIERYFKDYIKSLNTPHNLQPKKGL